ncbi:hypothetical protein [Virgisporangium aliadipatigenens]|uniref:hypothetical protein n=1 Tax=Virgisporangium aliadipatigenens TaxID=741659 RepID=UPI001942C2BF|nr:hypothetical protein [Virgisporangium aliadipatigenens]
MAAPALTCTRAPHTGHLLMTSTMAGVIPVHVLLNPPVEDLLTTVRQAVRRVRAVPDGDVSPEGPPG